MDGSLPFDWTALSTAEPISHSRTSARRESTRSVPLSTPSRENMIFFLHGRDYCTRWNQSKWWCSQMTHFFGMLLIQINVRAGGSEKMKKMSNSSGTVSVATFRLNVSVCVCVSVSVSMCVCVCVCVCAWLNRPDWHPLGCTIKTFWGQFEAIRHRVSFPAGFTSQPCWSHIRDRASAHHGVDEGVIVCVCVCVWGCVVRGSCF